MPTSNKIAFDKLAIIQKYITKLPRFLKLLLLSRTQWLEQLITELEISQPCRLYFENDIWKRKSTTVTLASAKKTPLPPACKPRPPGIIVPSTCKQKNPSLWRIQGRGSGPPFIFRPKCGRRAENHFFETGPSLSQGLNDRPPPPPHPYPKVWIPTTSGYSLPDPTLACNSILYYLRRFKD